MTTLDLILLLFVVGPLIGTIIVLVERNHELKNDNLRLKKSEREALKRVEDMHKALYRAGQVRAEHEDKCREIKQAYDDLCESNKEVWQAYHEYKQKYDLLEESITLKNNNCGTTRN